MKKKLVQKQRLIGGWKWMPLLDVANVEKGTEPGSASYSNSEGTRFLRIGEVSGKSDMAIYTISENINLVTEQDILMTFDGSPGLVCRGLNGAISSGIRKIYSKDENVLDNNYLFWILQSNIVQKVVNKYTQGSILKHAGSSIKHIKIPIPPFSIQKQIVAKLDAQMTKIEIMKKIAENELISSQVLYKSYLEKLFRNEADRSTKQLNDYIKFMVSGISRPFQSQDVGIPVLRSNNVTWGDINFDDLRYWYNPDDRGTSYDNILLQKGDVLVNFVNGSVKELGKTAVFNGYVRDVIITTNFWRVVFDISKLIPEYFQLFSMTERYIKQINKKGKFQGPGSFNQTDFKTIEMPIPPILRQKEIIDITNNLKSIVKDLIKNSNKILISTNELIPSILNKVFDVYGVPNEVDNG